MKQAYIEKKFGKANLAIIAQANSIIDEFAADGYDLTVRQLYYQFVARDIFPECRRWVWTGSRWKRDPNGTKNAEPNYKWLGGLINDGRLAGLIDWESILDRTRNYESLMHWSGPADRLKSAARTYRINTRWNQVDYIEVWIEKDALVGIVEQACDPLDIGYLSCRGYVSQSAMWAAGWRFLNKENFGKDTFLIHLGDHDPSGVDMTRDIQDRLRMFGSTVTVERIALSMNQIKQYNPPPNPVKATDSRHQPYIEKYGAECWELDALDPHVLTELIKDAISLHTQDQLIAAQIERQEDERKQIQEIADNWKR